MNPLRQNFRWPAFFPDATRAIIKSLDSTDIQSTKTPGILVNTWHLLIDPGPKIIKKAGGIKKFMNWNKPIISDSGGFQLMSLLKSNPSRGKITDKGIKYQISKNKNLILTPEKSIKFQFTLKTDLMVVLDDFTPPNATYAEAKKTVRRTILWAKKCKTEFETLSKPTDINNTPLLIAVVQGGKYLDLRAHCADELTKIGFDGFGFGGWPINQAGKFHHDIAKLIADHAPKDYLLYGLGIGKPEDISACVKLGYHLFDCVLPTRDARHSRLYIWNKKSKLNYSFFSPKKEKHSNDFRPIDSNCDCHLCKNYSRAYLHHLFKIKEFTAGRLATIHNLRFYSKLINSFKSL